MAEEDDGATPRRPSPPTPKKFKIESEEEPTGQFKDKDQSEEESKEIEDEDEDGPAPPWHHSSPPLLDLIDFPPTSTLPPTPPLPSSPRDFDMEQQDSDEDDGPPPGWDKNYQLKEQVDQILAFAAASVISADLQTKDVQQDAHNEEGEPQSQAHPCLKPEVAPSVEEHDSEDDGPPPGWDSKCQPEADLENIPRSDTKMDDVLQDAQNEEGQPTPEVPSVDREDSEDEGPPPGWASKCQSEPNIENTPQSDSSDIRTDNVQQDAWDENGSQSQSHCNPAPEHVPTDMKVEEHESEDDGPPPGWNLKCQLEPNSQMICPTTPPSDSKNEEDKEETPHNEGSPPGWRSTPQQQSHVHSTLPSPNVHSDF